MLPEQSNTIDTDWLRGRSPLTVTRGDAASAARHSVVRIVAAVSRGMPVTMRCPRYQSTMSSTLELARGMPPCGPSSRSPAASSRQAVSVELLSTPTGTGSRGTDVAPEPRSTGSGVLRIDSASHIDEMPGGTSRSTVRRVRLAGESSRISAGNNSTDLGANDTRPKSFAAASNLSSRSSTFRRAKSP